LASIALLGALGLILLNWEWSGLDSEPIDALVVMGLVASLWGLLVGAALDLWLATALEIPAAIGQIVGFVVLPRIPHDSEKVLRAAALTHPIGGRSGWA
jgi:hypothetical protein